MRQGEAIGKCGGGMAGLHNVYFSYGKRKILEGLSFSVNPGECIVLAGPNGSGKSTLVNKLAGEFPKLHVCREGDYNPIDLAWCALMSQTQYERVLETYKELEAEIRKNTTVEKEEYIVTYTKIHTDLPGFYKELENFEVYCGRKTWPELKDIILERFRGFTQTGYLFECAFFQNIVPPICSC